jgi:hypothetical protein
MCSKVLGRLQRRLKGRGRCAVLYGLMCNRAACAAVCGLQRVSLLTTDGTHGAGRHACWAVGYPEHCQRHARRAALESGGRGLHSMRCRRSRAGRAPLAQAPAAAGQKGGLLSRALFRLHRAPGARSMACSGEPLLNVYAGFEGQRLALGVPPGQAWIPASVGDISSAGGRACAAAALSSPAVAPARLESVPPAG